MKETQRSGYRCKDDIRRGVSVWLQNFTLIPLHQIPGSELADRNWLGEVAACDADD